MFLWQSKVAIISTKIVCASAGEFFSIKFNDETPFLSQKNIFLNYREKSHWGSYKRFKVLLFLLQKNVLKDNTFVSGPTDLQILFSVSSRNQNNSGVSI